jgi:guanosine-3',5'-bis(diphosphate) 3'-pyrophosphohydrolase
MKKTSQIEKAIMLADCMHCNQKYGKHNFMHHLKQVHSVLVRFNVTNESILVAAYLHDIVEDCQLKVHLIENYFGPNVANLVYAVTDELGRTRAERKAKTLHKLIDFDDAITLKLADRIANVEACLIDDDGNLRMYQDELAQFEAIIFKSPVAKLNATMLSQLKSLLIEEG